MKTGELFFDFCNRNMLGNWKLCENYNISYFELNQFEINKLFTLNSLYDATKGGLVLGKLHREGGIHLLKPLENGCYKYVGEMEGWEYLSKPIYSDFSLNKYEEINNRIKPFWRNYSFIIPFNCKLIDTSKSEVAFLLLSNKEQFIINRAATKKYISEIIDLDSF